MKAPLLLCLLCCASDDCRFTVTPRDGKPIHGTIALPTLSMKTSFGVVTFHMDKVASIQFGDPDLVTAKDQTMLRGKIELDELTVTSDAGEVRFEPGAVASIFADRGPVAFEPGETVDGIARNNVTYHVRVPLAHDAEQDLDAIVILHGSNMSSRAYLNTILAAWPKLADQYILIGINGEYRVQNSPDDSPAYNYSGVNFVGKSKYKGYPNTDRESPALIAEVIQEIKERLRIGKIFLGGHSQGGFVTYSVLMNYPELVAGAFPVSSGLWMQCEPAAYEATELRALQRKVPLAIVHGENDPVVRFDQGRAGFDSFDDDGFPMLHLFTDKSAGHMFARLPVEQAIRWLERMSSDNAESLVGFAEQRLAAGDFRDAVAAIIRARSLAADAPLHSRLDSLDERIAKVAEPQAKVFERLIATAKDDTWVRDFARFRAQFQFAAGARPVMDAYRELRAAHEGPATKLWNESRADFQAGKTDAGYNKYEEIAKKYYGSSWYRYAKPALEKRDAGVGK